MKAHMKKILSIWVAASVSASLSITIPNSSAGERYVATESVSPEGDKYSIGWIADEEMNYTSVGSRSTPSRDYKFESFKVEGGLKTVIHIESESAPTVYSFPLKLPKGLKVIPFSDGGVALFDDGELVATFQPPWALDANGNAVETHIAIKDGVLTQTVLHDSNTSFPVVADPQVDWGWSKTTVYLSKEETRVTGGATGAGALAALPWMAAIGVSGPVGVAILAAAGKISYDAIRAHQHGKCLGIVADVSNVPSFNGPVSTFEYTGKECK